jgi:N-acyl-D-aspartate/D-glutamate deacylase
MRRIEVEQVPVIQDGRWFRDDHTGDVLFESSIAVLDGDVVAAGDARDEFIAWCPRNGIVPLFV